MKSIKQDSRRKRKGKGEKVEITGVTDEDLRTPSDETIPVCMGEFGLDEARKFRPLWEATWPQDARSSSKKK